MKRSITCLGMSLGAAALLALGAGCSRDSRPAQQPTSGSTSPTFESNVPPSGQESGAQGAMGEQGAMGGQQGAMGQQGAGQQGAMGAQGSQQGAGQQGGAMGGQQGAQGGQQGATGEQPGTGAQGGQQAPMAGQSEREMCDTLASGAKLHVEDVQNGVAIVAAPRAGSNLATVRDDAQRIDRMIHQGPGAGAPGAGGEACGLFSLARLPSVTTTVTEGANSVRIVMTTSNPSEVRDLRRVARDQVGTMSKSAPGAHQRGGAGQRGGAHQGQQRPTQPGTQPR